jgi:hypothetical protein
MKFHVPRLKLQTLGGGKRVFNVSRDGFRGQRVMWWNRITVNIWLKKTKLTIRPGSISFTVIVKLIVVNSDTWRDQHVSFSVFISFHSSNQFLHRGLVVGFAVREWFSYILCITALQNLTNHWKKTHKLVHFQVMQDLRFLPLTPDAVEQKVSAFRGYSDEIRRVLPEVLLAMMTILLNQYRAK